MQRNGLGKLNEWLFPAILLTCHTHLCFISAHTDPAVTAPRLFIELKLEHMSSLAVPVLAHSTVSLLLGWQSPHNMAVLLCKNQHVGAVPIWMPLVA